MSVDQPVIIGLNIGHDGGCAIFAKGRITAVGEERVNRRRYSSGWIAALFYCLEAENIPLNSVDMVVFSSIGERLPTGFTGGLEAFGLPARRVVIVDHHLSHAYTAFCLSEFDSAVVAVLDGAGNDADTESYYVATSEGLTRIASNDPRRPRCGGVGATYEAFTNYIGFHEQEAGKTMALASYGDAGHWNLPLFDVSGLQVFGRLRATHEVGVIELARRDALNLGTPNETDSQIAMNLAAWVQSETERVVSEVILELVLQTGIRNVCLAGGVAMNCVANERIRLQTMTNLFVPPPASDRGQALGNVFIGYHLLTKELLRRPLRKDEFGKIYSDDEILGALKRHPHIMHSERHPRAPFSFRKENDPALAAAQLLADGMLVGWFQGGSELGARALGNRSILADPRTVESRDRLNANVKRREWFRPFAPSATAEAVSDWFDTGAPNAFMLFATNVNERKRAQIPGVVHVDGSARLQSVTAVDHPLFHRLIERFGYITGIPMVINTSFNVQEPIVESPADALATFRSSALDAMLIGDYLAIKE